MSWPVFMDCSSCWNCASCDMNCAGSDGFRGSWFLSWATRSCRNMFLVTAVEGLAVAFDELWPAALAVVLLVVGWLIGDMGSLLGSFVDFVRDHHVDVLLRIAVVVKVGDDPGVDHPSVGELHHLVRLVLRERPKGCDGVGCHHLAAHHL